MNLTLFPEFQPIETTDTTKAHYTYQYKLMREGKVSYTTANTEYSSSTVMYDVLRQMQAIVNPAQDVEVFICLLLNRANKPIGFVHVGTGGMTGCVADPRVILRHAILSGAVAIILNHNHPSGNTRPSKADEEVTYKLKQGGQLLDIIVLDHIITTGTDKNDPYFSFEDNGIL